VSPEVRLEEVDMTSPLPTPRRDERHIRVGDAERDQAVGSLREHYAQGRIDAAELDERLSAALVARTRGELARLFTDLPGERRSAPVRSAAYDPWRLTRRLFAAAPVVAAIVMGLVILAVIWAAVVVGGFLLWLLFAWWLIARASGRGYGMRCGRAYHHRALR
jgi:hypothetical protein